MLKALVFDVDGTLADTEMAHLAAFNHAFTEADLDWRWDVPLYTELLGIAGGKERIRAYWERQAAHMKVLDATALDDTIDRIHRIKTAAYEQAVQQGSVTMRPGVLALMAEARDAGLLLAIATTTTPANIAALLGHAIGPDWAQQFAVIEDGASAPRKKPDPLVYQRTLQRLALPAASCLAFEDSHNGLLAARAAGLATLVTPNSFTAGHDFTGAMRIVPSLDGIGLAALRAWHAQANGPGTATNTLKNRQKQETR